MLFNAILGQVVLYFNNGRPVGINLGHTIDGWLANSKAYYYMDEHFQENSTNTFTHFVHHKISYKEHKLALPVLQYAFTIS